MINRKNLKSPKDIKSENQITKNEKSNQTDEQNQHEQNKGKFQEKKSTQEQLNYTSNPYTKNRNSDKKSQKSPIRNSKISPSLKDINKNQSPKLKEKINNLTLYNEPYLLVQKLNQQIKTQEKQNQFLQKELSFSSQQIQILSEKLQIISEENQFVQNQVSNQEIQISEYQEKLNHLQQLNDNLKFNNEQLLKQNLQSLIDKEKKQQEVNETSNSQIKKNLSPGSRRKGSILFSSQIKTTKQTQTSPSKNSQSKIKKLEQKVSLVEKTNKQLKEMLQNAQQYILNEQDHPQRESLQGNYIDKLSKIIQIDKNLSTQQKFNQLYFYMSQYTNEQEEYHKSYKRFPNFGDINQQNIKKDLTKSSILQTNTSYGMLTDSEELKNHATQSSTQHINLPDNETKKQDKKFTKGKDNKKKSQSYEMKTIKNDDQYSCQRKDQQKMQLDQMKIEVFRCKKEMQKYQRKYQKVKEENNQLSESNKELQEQLEKIKDKYSKQTNYENKIDYLKNIIREQEITNNELLNKYNTLILQRNKQQEQKQEQNQEKQDLDCVQKQQNEQDKQMNENQNENNLQLSQNRIDQNVKEIKVEQEANLDYNGWNCILNTQNNMKDLVNKKWKMQILNQLQEFQQQIFVFGQNEHQLTSFINEVLLQEKIKQQNLQEDKCYLKTIEFPKDNYLLLFVKKLEFYMKDINVQSMNKHQLQQELLNKMILDFAIKYNSIIIYFVQDDCHNLTQVKFLIKQVDSFLILVGNEQQREQFQNDQDNIIWIDNDDVIQIQEIIISLQNKFQPKKQFDDIFKDFLKNNYRFYYEVNNQEQWKLDNIKQSDEVYNLKLRSSAENQKIKCNYQSLYQLINPQNIIDIDENESSILLKLEYQKDVSEQKIIPLKINDQCLGFRFKVKGKNDFKQNYLWLILKNKFEFLRLVEQSIQDKNKGMIKFEKI